MIARTGECSSLVESVGALTRGLLEMESMKPAKTKLSPE